MDNMMLLKVGVTEKLYIEAGAKHLAKLTLFYT